MDQLWHLVRLFGFVSRFISGESSFWRFILLSSLGISSPRAFLSPRLNTFDPKLLVGNYAFFFRSCICPVFKYNLKRECRHRSSALCRSHCFLLHGGRGVLTVLQRNDHHCNIQSLSLARICGEWRTVGRVSLWICWTFNCARVNRLKLTTRVNLSSRAQQIFDYYARSEMLS